MRIVIDLQTAQHEAPCSPAGQDALALALAIARNRGAHEVLLALNGRFPDSIEFIRALFAGVLPQENIRVWYAPKPFGPREPDNSRQIAARIREAFLASLQPDIVHVSCLFAAYTDDEPVGRVLREAEAMPGALPAPLNDPVWDLRARRAIAAFAELQAVRTSPAAETEEREDIETLCARLIETIAPLVPPLPPCRQETHLAELAQAIAASLPVPGKKQLFVDVSAIAQEDAKTGIQRVTRSILKEFFAHPPDGYTVEPVYASPHSAGYRYARRYAACLLNKKCNGEDEAVEWQAGDLFLAMDLQHRTLINQRDYLLRLRRDGVKIIAIVYDLLPISMPQAFALEPGLHAKWLETIAEFDGAACISRAVADELMDWLDTHGQKRLRPFQISWFHLGADIESSAPTFGLPDDAGRVLERLASAPTFLLVGRVEPRKRQEQALYAFEQLWAEGRDLNLVIVGKQGWKVDALAARLHAHPQLGKRLFWLKDISDEYLEKIYAAAVCLIAASEGEGFGLPVIEAAWHKLPILARGIPVFREIAGEHALYFDGTEPGDLAMAVERWLSLAEAGSAPQPGGLQWLTWAESAEQLKQGLYGNACYRQWISRNGGTA